MVNLSFLGSSWFFNQVLTILIYIVCMPNTTPTWPWPGYAKKNTSLMKVNPSSEPLVVDAKINDFLASQSRGEHLEDGATWCIGHSGPPKNRTTKMPDWMDHISWLVVYSTYPPEKYERQLG